MNAIAINKYGFPTARLDCLETVKAIIYAPETAPDGKPLIRATLKVTHAAANLDKFKFHILPVLNSRRYNGEIFYVRQSDTIRK